MAARTCIPCITLSVLLAAIPAGAQWPWRDPPGVPRTADGEPDWTAPPPRTADGRPDFSGLWRGGGGELGRRGDLSDGRYVSPAGSNPIAVGLPFTEYGAAVREKRESREGGDNPRAHCRPMGIMQLHVQALPAQYIQRPDSLVILYEGNGEWRQIFTDGRSLPPRGVTPQSNGYSVGRWDGDTLIVETIGFRDDGWLDTIGSPLTDEGKIVERFRRPRYGRLEIEVTIEDPKAYRQPFTVGVFHSPLLGPQLMEFVCRENNRFLRHWQR